MHSPGGSWPRAPPPGQAPQRGKAGPVSPFCPGLTVRGASPPSASHTGRSPSPAGTPDCFQRPVDGVQTGGGRGAGGGQAPTLDWQFRVHTPLPWPLLVPLPEMRYLPSTITRTPMRPTKPSLNVAASGIPGGSHNTLIKFQHHLFCSRLSYLSTSAHAKSDRLLYEHRLCAGRGMALGGRRAGQAQSRPLRIDPWVRLAVWAGPTFGPGHGALATGPWGSPGGGEGLGPRPLLPKWASMSPESSLSEPRFPHVGL